MVAELPIWFWIFVAPELVGLGIGLVALLVVAAFGRDR